MYRVKQLADMAGVSVRTLHYYDEIGLLKPAYVGANGYRAYGRDDVLRLQQILLHRALGFSLRAIAAILDDPQFDRLSALERQHAQLVAEQRRRGDLIATIERTIQHLKENGEMQAEDFFTGITPERQHDYEAWLIARFGSGIGDAIARSKTRYAELDKAEIDTMQRQWGELVEGFALAWRGGARAGDGAQLDGLLARHRAWIEGIWDRPCTPEAYAGLADVYDHPDFRMKFDRVGEGFADYLINAMKAWAERQR